MKGDVFLTPKVEPEIELERYELREAPRYQFDLDRRDFFRLVGSGIVVCLLVDGEADAQQRGFGGRGGSSGPQEIGGWLHIAESGEVTVYTGKVEVGQNIRTSLSQAVAEELRVPVASIKLVMADTQLTPPDGGTSGSRTTPDMAARLRRVAAAAREVLVDLAAEQMKSDRATLKLADGQVADPTTGRALAYGELTKGQKLTKTIQADVSTTPASMWKVAGTSVPKVDGAAIVTGRHHYASDIKLPGMLFGKVLRPPTLNSKLKSVDLAAAQAKPGATAVRDGEFVGVAAPTVQQAEQALAAIKAEWTTPDEASSTTLFDDLKRMGDAGGGGRGGFGGGGFGRGGGGTQGNIDEGLAAAAHKLAATYTIAYIAHAPLEPRAAVAQWEGGKLTVWTGSQRPFGIMGDLTRVFGLPPQSVRVIVPDTGSAYGGKHTNEATTEAARLAKAAGRPVKLVWTREEEFTWAYFRPAGVIEVNAGTTKEGKLTAWDFHNYNSGGSSIQPLYDIPNRRTATHSSRVPLKQGSYRALAATANTFARECHVDDLAKAAGVDPLEFRLRNLTDTRLRAVLVAAAEQFGWGHRQPAAGYGFGIAGSSDKGSYVATCAEVEMPKAGSKLRVVRAVTAFECGAIVNPDHLKNQVEGAVMMGLGGALFEAIAYEKGQITNASFSDYRVPRFADLPEMETVLVNRPDLPSAGAGETPIIAIAPAIGNAIFQATGVRLRSLPMDVASLKA
jgi:CO/xanthine dehydrogenase Mo-binding subunit